MDNALKLPPEVVDFDLRNKLIAVPRKLFTDDGREIRITHWRPALSVGSFVEVHIHARILPPKAADKSPTDT